MPTFGFSAYLKLICLNTKPQRREVRGRLMPKNGSSYDFHRSLRLLARKHLLGREDQAELIRSVSSIVRDAERGSLTFDTFTRYAKHGIIIGFIFAMYTIPFMIADPKPAERFAINNILMASWVGLAAMTLAMFFRVATHLFSLFETKVRHRRAGG